MVSDLALGQRRDGGVPDQGLRALAPALALLVVSVLATCIAGLWPNGAGGQYAVIAPPWYDLGRVLQLASAADGEVVGVGGWRNVAVVHADSPRAVWALYAAGAWLVLDPVKLRGCLGLSAPGGA